MLSQSSLLLLLMMAHFLHKRSGELAMKRILSLQKRVQASSKPQELHSVVLHVHVLLMMLEGFMSRSRS